MKQRKKNNMIEAYIETNMSLKSSEVQSIVKMIKEKHPNVQVIGQFDCIKTLKDYFNGLC